MLVKSAKSFFPFCLVMLCFVLTACDPDGGTQMRSSRPSMPKSNVAPQLASACEIATANKYYLPRRVIHAYHATAAQDGTISVKIKADLREAVCSVSASGTIRSVVDVSPKSADQLAAEQAAVNG